MAVIELKRTILTEQVKGVKNLNPETIGFWSLVREDFRTHESDFFSQGFWALFWHRYGNWRMGLPTPLRKPASLMYRMMHKATQWFCGIDLPYTVKVGRRVKLEHFGGMVLIAKSIGNDVYIRQNTTFGIARKDRPTEWPVIGDGVDIGVGVAVLGAVYIGNNATVGANSVVIKDVAPETTVVGAPALPLNSHEQNSQIYVAE